MMSIFKRLQNLWKLGAIDLSEVKERIEQVKRKQDQAIIVDMSNPLDRIKL